MREPSATSGKERLQDGAAGKRGGERGGPVLGLASVAVGVLGFVWALAGATLLVTAPLGLAALGCGVLGWNRARQRRPPGRRDMAAIGSSLGVLALLGGVLTGTGGSGKIDPGSEPRAAAALPGEAIRMGGVEVAVTDVRSAPSDSPASSGTRVTVVYQLTNITGSDKVFDKSAQIVYADGQAYPASAQGTLEVSDSATMLLMLEPGVTTRGKVAFSVPDAARLTTIGVVSSDGTEHLVTAP
ncbi:DUF4352 domain-containing protein [Haloechinothrix salitolerans]|uniref:DUF4352 domain-containing protein n=1 Tax=Haloechinothrix salitolerans TaxID=926830 RepID=A0ABW2BUN2_9PSEU